MKKLWAWRFDVSVYVFALAVALLHLGVFQHPLVGYALSVSDAGSNALVNVISLQVLQIALMVSFLLLLAAVSVTLAKIVATAFVITNAIALYFMRTYGIELDISMISNILGTNTRQSFDLWHWHIAVYFVVLGLLPVIAIWKARIRRPRWFASLAASVGVFAALLAFLFATSFTWLWYDAHGTRLGARILPWSYVVNTGRYYNKKAKSNREQELLPDATFTGAAPAGKDIVVLILGEATRAANYDWYGYERDTTPYTDDKDLAIFPYGDACSTNTIGSMACINTHEGREAGSRTGYEPLVSYMTRHGVETIYRTNGAGEPPFNATSLMRGSEVVAECAGDDCPDPYLDGALNYKLGEALDASEADRILVTFHHTGSHGPRYSEKYPEAFEVFTPVCRTVQVAECDQQILVNAYDNTLVYNDYLMADLIDQLDRIDNANVVLIYVSDHGQSLGEGGMYLHGVPPAIAPAEQFEVPFFIWMNDAFKQSRGLTTDAIVTDVTYPHDFPFHSVMGAFGMRSDIYKPEYDVFNSEVQAN
ncbi:sulfatase-like hydrolase/transferase [Yoonia sp. 208BN28-4]|uniref:sulfatase-like hydrolase/transferase n=1 Tax=Yoonia sp. 208BN28-4 TaxID=3126505 RepID=UPI0030ACC8CD